MAGSNSSGNSLGFFFGLKYALIHSMEKSPTTTLEFINAVDIDQCQSVQQLRQFSTTAESRLRQLQQFIRSDISSAKQHYLATAESARYQQLDQTEQAMNQEAAQLIAFVEQCDRRIAELTAES